MDPAWVTGFKWARDQSDMPFSSARFENQNNLLAISTEGAMRMPEGWYIDIVPLPSDKWFFQNPSKVQGTPFTPGEPCDWPGKRKLTCLYHRFPGSPHADIANGMRLQVNAEIVADLESDLWEFRWSNLPIAVNHPWVLTSHVTIPRQDANGNATRSVLLDVPYFTKGDVFGRIVSWELAAASQFNWVILTFTPGNTVQPMRPSKELSVTYAGAVNIIPAEGLRKIKKFKKLINF